MIYKAMILLQIILCFISAVILIAAHHKNHSYLAGFIASCWAGAMLAIAVSGMYAWPNAVQGACLAKTIACGVSAGLAVWSGGSVFRVLRLLHIRA